MKVREGCFNGYLSPLASPLGLMTVHGILPSRSTPPQGNQMPGSGIHCAAEDRDIM